MALLLAGLAATLYGLFPSLSTPSGTAARIRVRALDDAPLSRAHLGLLLVLAAAVTIDVMKPVTLSFVVPGMAREYGLKSPLNPAGTASHKAGLGNRRGARGAGRAPRPGLRDTRWPAAPIAPSPPVQLPSRRRPGDATLHVGPLLLSCRREIAKGTIVGKPEVRTVRFGS
jgi:hypothetical protein